jgi:ABC-2 type transport system permease protein
MSAALLIARTELRGAARSRSALLMAVVAPVTLAVVLGTLASGSGASFDIGVVVAARPNAAVSALRRADVDSQALRLRRQADEAAARRAVQNGTLDAAIVFRAADAVPTVLRRPDRPLAAGLARALALATGARERRKALSVATVQRALGRPAGAALVAAAGREPATLAPVEVRGAQAHSGYEAHLGASLVMLFGFFTLSSGVRSLMAERRTGTLVRYLSTPAPAAALVAGKALAAATLALGGFVTVWAVTTAAFGARWGPAWAVAVLMAATVLALAGLAMFAASAARDERRAALVTAATTFGLSALGGGFSTPGGRAEPIERLALLTPNGWALRAFADLGAGVAPGRALLPAVVVLLGIGAGFAAAGVAQLRRLVPR